MSFDGKWSEVFKLFKDVKVNTEDIPIIEIKLIYMLKDWIISKLKISVVSILETPSCTMFGKFTVEDLNFSFVLNIFCKFFTISHRILIHPQNLQIQVIKLFNNLINFIFRKLIGHQGQCNRIGRKFKMRQLSELHVVELQFNYLQ